MSPWHVCAQNVSIMCPKFGHILDTSYTRLNYNFVVQPIGKCPKCDHNVSKVTIMDICLIFILLKSRRISVAPADALGQPMQMC